MNIKLCHLICIGVIIFITLSSCRFLYKLHDDRRQKERVRITTSAIYSIAIAAWPAIFLSVLHSIDMHSITNAMMFAFAWPICLLMWDLVESGWRRRVDEHTETQRYLSNKSNASIIIGGAWALGTLLASITGRSNGHTAGSAKIIMISLVMCVAFVLPIPGDGPRRSVTNITIAATQKSALNYAVGLFILGIVLAWKS